MVGLDLNTIRHALGIAREKGYHEVRLKASGVEFCATISKKSVSKARRQAEVEQTVVPDVEVPAPCVGYFKPLAKPVRIGQTVKIGEVLGQIMALGLPNDVESTVGGEVTEILVKEGDPVQFGQTIVKVKVAP